jgi:co-chaperonin GroES (HSP10)
MIRPRHKRLLVEPIDEEKPSQVIEVIQFDKFNTKSSGVEAKSWTRGRVLRMASDCSAHGAQPGDIVRFTKNGGLPVSHDGKDYLLLSEKDLIGVEVEALSDASGAG